ncbi:MAG: ubiquinone/menaquinone biosynthesis methyltransferase [candidate division WOR-3 bacterium]
MKGDFSVPQMFDKISHKYEFLNHLFSFYLDEYWRKKLASFTKGKVLDAATGTGEVIKHIIKNKDVKFVVGIDLAPKMLSYAIKNKNYKNAFYILADGQKLPFKNNSFDSLTIAFGIRNIENRIVALSEFYRVLKDDGVLAILEMLGPTGFLKYPFRFYIKHILPPIAKIFIRDKEPYIYLYNSIFNFPKREEFIEIIKSVGFKRIKLIELNFGICTIFLCEK